MPAEAPLFVAPAGLSSRGEQVRQAPERAPTPPASTPHSATVQDCSPVARIYSHALSMAHDLCMEQLLCTVAASDLMDASTVEDPCRCILMLLLFIDTAEAGRDGPQHDADQPGRGDRSVCHHSAQ